MLTGKQLRMFRRSLVPSSSATSIILLLDCYNLTMEAAGYSEISVALCQPTGCQYQKTESAIFTAVKPDNSQSVMQ